MGALFISRKKTLCRNRPIYTKLLGRLSVGSGIFAPKTHYKMRQEQLSHQVVLTDKALYYSIAMEQDKKYFAKGRIPCEKIESFRIEKTDAAYNLMCDDYLLAGFSVDKATTEDFIGLGNYFDCIAKHDFEITDEEVDTLIREKIGSKVYEKVKKYLVYDDEKSKTYNIKTIMLSAIHPDAHIIFATISPSVIRNSHRLAGSKGFFLVAI